MSKITRTDLSTRFQDYPRSNYITIFSVMKGVVLANATIVAGSILQADDFSLPWILLWLASFLAVVLTHQATMVGTIIIAWRLKYREVVLSFLLGILEFGLFSCSNTKIIGPWLLCFAAFSVVGGLLAYNAYREASPEQYDDGGNVRVIVEAYAREQRTAALIAGVSALVWFAVCRLSWSMQITSRTGLAISSLALANIALAIVHQRKYTRTFFEALAIG